MSWRESWPELSPSQPLQSLAGWSGCFAAPGISMHSSRLQQYAQEFGVVGELLARCAPVEYDEAQFLVMAAKDADGREHLLTPGAATAWRNMQSAAAESGISMFIVSGFRSIERQAEIVRRKLSAGQSIDQVLSVSALPGCSEHHTGRAIDIGTKDCALLEPEFEKTAAFDWLQRNASIFGFRLSYPRDNLCGYTYEPWHWLHQDA